MGKLMIISKLLGHIWSHVRTVQVRKLVDRELQEPLFDVFLWGVLFKYKTKF